MELITDDIFYVILSHLNLKDCNILEQLNKKTMVKLYDKRNVLLSFASMNKFCFLGITKAVKLIHEIKLIDKIDFVFEFEQLKWAIIKNKYKTIKYICENIKTQNDDLCISMAINDACKYGHLNIVKYLKNKYLKNCNLDFIKNFSNACHSGNLKLIKFIYSINIKNSIENNNCNHHVNNKKKHENWEKNFYDISQNNIIDINNLHISYYDAKNIIDILKNAIINENYRVIIFLINKYEECYNGVLLLLCTYKKYDMIKKIIDKYNIFITYSCINEIFKNIDDLTPNNNEIIFIYKYMCSKIKIKKLNRCCSHIVKYNNILRCNNMASNLNDMCMDHLNITNINLKENDVKKIIICIYCEFNSNKLSRCKQNNIGNGFCLKHSNNINNFNKFMLIQIQLDVIIIKKMIDITHNMYYNKSLKIKKMIMIFQYVCDHVLMILNNEKFKNVVIKKLIEFIGEVDDDNKKKFQLFLDFVLSL